MNTLKLARDFSQLLKETLSPQELSEVIQLNQSVPIHLGCHSHDFCDPNQVMIEAMAMQNEEFEAENFEQGCAINRAWDLAKKAGFDASYVFFKVAGCVSIGSKRLDGDIRLLCTINNNDDELSPEDWAQLIDHVVSCYQSLEIDAEVFFRQDCVDYFTPEENLANNRKSTLEPVDPGTVSAEVAYELGAMGVVFSGIQPDQLDEATKRAKQKCLVVWGIEDVNQQALDDDIDVFTTEQAMMVLERLKQHHDAGTGVNWDVISSTIASVVD